MENNDIKTVDNAENKQSGAPEGQKNGSKGNRGNRHKDKKKGHNHRKESSFELEGDEELIAEDNIYAKDDITAPSGESKIVPDRAEYEVVGVRFKQNGKVYYFDPNGLSLQKDVNVIVDTARGIEFGTVLIPNRTVPAKEVVLPLRKAVRVATPEDEKHRLANEEKETEAYNLCLSKIEERRLDMKLVDVEFTFDNSKLLFYFTAEGRVDFRDLVKDLASVFRTRIELRQIGIRDEAKLLGGLGVCGRPFCCASFLPDFVQVSIKMAKEQNLSLNAAKISGACGRLMCCLRYEYDTYCEEIALTPKVDSLVDTPDGEGVVVETSPLAGVCKVSLNKNPASLVLYHRDDLTVKGSVKGRKKANGEATPEKPADEGTKGKGKGDKKK